MINLSAVQQTIEDSQRLRVQFDQYYTQHFCRVVVKDSVNADGSIAVRHITLDGGNA